MRVSVIGGSTVTDEQRAVAERVGREVGRRGHELVCGGRGGVMLAACRGARGEGAHTIGILPEDDRGSANPHVETAIATGIGHARNPLVAMNGDGVVAVDGGPGTISEIGHALVYEKPVAGLGTHDVDGVRHVETPEAALELIERDA
jgi:uncharacterized protein (TIGR00725 family)